MSHCEHCKGHGDPPARRAERDPSFEQFLAAWAAESGYAFLIEHHRLKSTVFLDRRAPEDSDA